MKLLDLFCGKGGWTIPALARGWTCIGYDITDFGYPGQLVRAQLPIPVPELRLHNPDLLVASPPCDEFARANLPFRDLPARAARRHDELQRAIQLLQWSINLINNFDCPVIIECSRFSAKYVRPRPRFVGSYALWGNLPALMPINIPRRKQRMSNDPTARAMIEPELSGWIFDTQGVSRR